MKCCECLITNKNFSKEAFFCNLQSWLISDTDVLGKEKYNRMADSDNSHFIFFKFNWQPYWALHHSHKHLKIQSMYINYLYLFLKTPRTRHQCATKRTKHIKNMLFLWKKKLSKKSFQAFGGKNQCAMMAHLCILNYCFSSPVQLSGTI